MIIMQVAFEIIPDHIESFITATLENGGHTVQEPGNLRFELLHDTQQDNRFLLIEIYVDQESMDDHFETDHFAAWRTATDSLLAGDPVMHSYTRLFPPAE